MTKTRLSLYYVVAYLFVAGTALLVAPSFALSLLLSNGTYDDVFPRFVGMTLLGLDLLVFQIVRLRIEQLYSTTLRLVPDQPRSVLPGRGAHHRDRRNRDRI